MIPFDKIGDQLIECLAPYVDTKDISPIEDDNADIKDSIDKVAKDSPLPLGFQTQQSCVEGGAYCAYDCAQAQQWAVVNPVLCIQYQAFITNCTAQNPWSCDSNADFRCTGANWDCQSAANSCGAKFGGCTKAFTQYDDTCTNNDPISCGSQATRFACGSITGEGFSCQDSQHGHHCMGQWFSCFLQHRCHSVIRDFSCESSDLFFCKDEFTCLSSAVHCVHQFVCDQVSGLFDLPACNNNPGHQFYCQQLVIHCDPAVFSCSLGQEYIRT